MRLSWAPWTDAQAKLVIGVNLVGMVLVVVAFVGLSGTAALRQQISWLNLAVVGLVVALSGDGMLLVTGRRAVGARRRRVLPDLVIGVAAAPGSAVATELVWLPGTIRAHRSSCPMISRAVVSTVDRDVVRREGLKPCEVCEP